MYLKRRMRGNDIEVQGKRQSEVMKYDVTYSNRHGDQNATFSDNIPYSRTNGQDERHRNIHVKKK